MQKRINSPRSYFQAQSKRRRGMAVVEMAFCLPVIVLVIFGGIQAANLIFLKQAISEAAYEGALFGSKPEATQAETVSRAVSHDIL